MSTGIRRWCGTGHEAVIPSRPAAIPAGAGPSAAGLPRAPLRQASNQPAAKPTIQRPRGDDRVADADGDAVAAVEASPIPAAPGAAIRPAMPPANRRRIRPQAKPPALNPPRRLLPRHRRRLNLARPRPANIFPPDQRIGTWPGMIQLPRSL